LEVSKIKEIWFDDAYIYGKDEFGIEYKQSLLWYPKLLKATDFYETSEPNNDLSTHK